MGGARWLIGAMLLAAVPLKDCGTVKVDGPKTAACPEGRYIVTYDESQTPPLVSYRCEKPAPSPGPDASPSPSPSPTPSSSPSPAPSTSPSPAPSPTPMPSSSPSAPPPSAPPGDAPIIPKIGECPEGWPLAPDFVTLGEKPWRAPANPYAWLFNATPRRTDPRYCLDENGNSRMRGGQCEEWIPCALRQKPDGSWLYQISAKAWGPGFNGDDVERRSNNPNLLNMVIGPDGSPPGHYRVCVAPSDKLIGTDKGTCREAELSLP